MSIFKKSKTSVKDLNKSLDKIKLDIEEKKYKDKIKIQNDSNYYLVLVFKDENSKINYLKNKKININKEFIYEDEI